MGEAEHDHPLFEPESIRVVDSPKYKDQDILNHPSLQAAAKEFLLNYHGSYEFLRRAKTQMLRTHTLPVGTVRGVVNCMRNQPGALHGQPLPGTPMALKPQLEMTPRISEIRRAAFVEANIKRWKHQFMWKPFPKGWASSPKPKQPVFHVIEPTRSVGRWYDVPEVMRHLHKYDRKLVMIPIAACGYTFQEWKSGNRGPDDGRLCLTCAKRTYALESVNHLGRDAPRVIEGEVVRD